MTLTEEINKLVEDKIAVSFDMLYMDFVQDLPREINLTKQQYSDINHFLSTEIEKRRKRLIGDK